MKTAQQQIQTAENNFNVAYSRFYIRVYLSGNPKYPSLTHYGNERKGCTVRQIAYKRITSFTLDREQGLQDCYNRIPYIAQRYGVVSCSMIYDRLQTDVNKAAICIAKIIGDAVEYYGKPLWEVSPKQVQVQAIYNDKLNTHKIVPTPQVSLKLTQAVERLQTMITNKATV